MPTAPCAFLELSIYTATIAVVSEKRLVAYHTASREAKDELTSFVAKQGVKEAQLLLVVPSESRALIFDVEGLPARTQGALLAHIQAEAPAVGAAAICSARTGETEVGATGPCLLVGTTSEAVKAAEDFAASIGLSPVTTMLALPGQLGAVMDALQDMSETASMAVWSLGEASSTLVLISAKGVSTVRRLEIGYNQIFEAVQAELGLRFKAAATKLFFNADYDFSDAAGRIAARLAAPLQGAWGAEVPSMLHLPDLAAGQQWLARAFSQTLNIPLWIEDAAATCGRNGLTADKMERVNAGLVRAAASDHDAQAPWLPRWLDPKAQADKPVAPVAAIVPPPSSAPASSASGGAGVTTPLRPMPVVKPTAVRPATAKVETLPKVEQAPKVKPSVAPVPRQPVVAAAPVPAPAPAKKETPPPSEINPVVQGEASSADVPVAAKSKKGLYIAGGVLAVIAIVGGGLAFSHGGKKPAAIASGKAPVVAAAVKNSSFSNARYHFEISAQGVIQNLADSAGHVLVSGVGLDKLQGSYQSFGERVNFNADGMDSPSHLATVERVDQPSGSVFNIHLTHPRFEMEETVTCLPDRLKISVRFVPLKLREERGVVSAVYSVKLAPDTLKADQPVSWSEHEAVYTTAAGPLAVNFDDSLWGRYGTNGRQRVTSTDSTCDFEFIGLYSEDLSLTLNYELRMP